MNVFLALPQPVDYASHFHAIRCNFSLTVEYLQVCAMKICPAFGCEESISPNDARGESFIHYAILILVFALKTPRVDRLAVKDYYLTQPSAWMMGNHSLMLPHYFIVHVHVNLN